MICVELQQDGTAYIGDFEATYDDTFEDSDETGETDETDSSKSSDSAIKGYTKTIITGRFKLEA